MSYMLLAHVYNVFSYYTVKHVCGHFRWRMFLVKTQQDVLNFNWFAPEIWLKFHKSNFKLILVIDACKLDIFLYPTVWGNF